jgi:hypothetical protein
MEARRCQVEDHEVEVLVLFSSHSVGKAVYPVHVRIVKGSKGLLIAFARPFDQL